jgi:predicted glycosyltransferase
MTAAGRDLFGKRIQQVLVHHKQAVLSYLTKITHRQYPFANLAPLFRPVRVHVVRVGRVTWMLEVESEVELDFPGSLMTPQLTEGACTELSGGTR